MKEAVQKALRKNFTVGYLKQIKTVFPEAYKYAWEHIIGRYGKKLADYELNIAVNSKYKEEMIQRLGGGAAPAATESTTDLSNSFVDTIDEGGLLDGSFRLGGW